MKEKDEHIEKKLELLMQQSREEAPEGFAARLMEALPAQQALPRSIFRPLLSIKAFALGVAILAGLSWLCTLFLQPPVQESPGWFSYRLPEFNLPFTIDATLLTVVLTAILLLAILDRYLKRSLGAR